MTLHPHEFIRRFLIHVLPKGFHRIRHYGLLRQHQSRREHRTCSRAARRCSAHRRARRAKARRRGRAARAACPCPRCGGRMIVIEVFARGCEPRRTRHQRRSGSTRHEPDLLAIARRKPPVPTCWSIGRRDPARPGHYARRTVRSLHPFRAIADDAYSTLPIAPACTSPVPSHLLGATSNHRDRARGSNPHSARCTAGAPPPAISCLGAFPTPAVAIAWMGRHPGVRKPAQEETSPIPTAA